MRRTALLLSLLLAVAVFPAGAEATVVSLPPGPGAFISENVDYVATIPDAPGIGGRVLTVDGQQRFYTTGSKGLVIYDVTNPALPTPIGLYSLPHFQNEDVDVSDDGSRVIISTDTVGVDRSGSTANGIHIIDTSNPAAPKRVGFIASGNHTTTCADPKCEWLYGSSGKVYDARNPAEIKEVGRWKASGGGHALNRDASGLMISDSTPRLVLDVTDPAKPVAVASGDVEKKFRPDGLLQHNNVRPNAEQWVPRDPASPDYNDPAMRAGELMIGNAESNIRPQCGGNAGGLSSWSMVNFDQTERITQLEVFRPMNGTYANGNPAVNALGCSGHWFTVRDNLIAASWYEHGVRFIEVNPTDGTFTEKGFFQPVATEAGAAHWITDAQGNEYVYSMDYARGIDILKFNRDKPAPTQAEINASWMAGLNRVGAAAEAERYLCRLSQS
jgi:hypothetical protein